VRHSADAIMVLDTQGRLEFCNPAFSEITGFSCDDVYGQRPEEFLRHSTDAVTSYRRMLELAQKAESGREVVANRDKKGRLFEWDCTLSPIVDGDGRVVNYVVTATDLSEEARIREELHRATRYDPLQPGSPA
jgi:PAS domain S-box-containing protein